MQEQSADPQEQSGRALLLEPWGAGDLPLLQRLMGDPQMMAHLGGPESAEQIVARQGRFERLVESGTGRMFKIVREATGEAVGSVGYWQQTWQGEAIYEIGWFVLPQFQGQGIARSATAQAIASLRAERERRFLHAFPAVENPPSNAICRKLGFVLLGECQFEYPKGSFMQCNDWRLDLHGE